jgi:ubiquinone biosynthesis protein
LFATVLKTDRIPTPLIEPGTRPPIRIVSVRPSGRFETIRLAFRLLRFLIAIQWMRFRQRSSLEVATHIRASLEALGGLWIKVGQIISLRTDLLSPEMADELSQLAYRAYGFPSEAARQVVEESLGQPIDAIFDVFEEFPFAAASISQVHRARLCHNGVWVAIKVQRPDITRVFARDLKLVIWLLRQMRRIRSVSYIDWNALIRELEQVVKEEVDYRYEATNLSRMRKLLRNHKVYIPKLFRRLSGQKILVMEYIPGVLMSDYLQMQRDDPARLAAWCEENNVRPRKVGARLQLSFYRQLLEENFFHGDLHPGNVMLLRNSRFALIDLGAVGNLDERFIKTYKAQARAFADGDYSKAIDAYLLLCDSVPAIDIAAFKAEMVQVARMWEARTHMKELTYTDKSISGSLALEMGAISRKFRVSPSWQLLRVSRAVSTLDGNLSVLLGTASPRKIIRTYFRQAGRRSVRRLLRGEVIRSVGRAIGDTADSAVYISDIIRRQTIQFQGVQTRAAYIFGVIFSAIRLAIFGAGLFLLYDFIHLHHNDLVAGIHEELELFATFAERFPPYVYEVGVIMLILVILAFIAAGRIKRRMAAPSVRLPNGRLES